MAGPFDPIGGFAPAPTTPGSFETPAARAARERAAGFGAEARRNAEEERRMFEEQMAALRGLRTGGEARMEAARLPQEAAVQVLGERAGTLEGGQSLLQTQAAREQAQARAMQAPGSILGGQIGAAQAGAMDAIAQEAAARQAAYLRGIQQVGAGMMTEAEQRRLTEAELIKDMQLRFAAAQQIAAANQERRAAQQQQQLGMIGSAAGTILGSFVGGPAGASVGGKLGGSLGGGSR